MEKYAKPVSASEMTCIQISSGRQSRQMPCGDRLSDDRSRSKKPSIGEKSWPRPSFDNAGQPLRSLTQRTEPMIRNLMGRAAFGSSVRLRGRETSSIQAAGKESPCTSIGLCRCRARWAQLSDLRELRVARAIRMAGSTADQPRRTSPSSPQMPPKDALDQLFLDHDKAYDGARTRRPRARPRHRRHSGWPVVA